MLVNRQIQGLKEFSHTIWYQKVMDIVIPQKEDYVISNLASEYIHDN